MTQQKEDTAIRTIFEIINSDGIEGLGDAVSILINEAMKVERSSALNAQPWQRTENRMGYANGFKNKSVVTKLGEPFEYPPGSWRCRVLSLGLGKRNSQ